MVQRTSKKIAIVGAGLAGLACADQLAAAGHNISLFDKARGPGGRMSTRRIETAIGEASFDHGAQYFTARDPDFLTLVLKWQSLGLAALWDEAGPDAWVGTPSMNAPIKHMAAAHDVAWSAKIDQIERDDAGWRLVGENAPGHAFEHIVLAVPAEQAAPLLEPWDVAMAKAAAATQSAPCWTVMLAFADTLPVQSKILRDSGAIGWAACNSSKPGRTGPETWVIQASPDWSQDNLECENADIIERLIAAFAANLNMTIPTPLIAQAHRWRYARSGAVGSDMLFNPSIRLGACGDWLLGPRVECAWLSGTALGRIVG
jgi:renalase